MTRRQPVSNPPAADKHQKFSNHRPQDERPDNDIDAMSEDSFPASDPPSTGGSAQAGRPMRHGHDDRQKPTLKKTTRPQGSA